MFTFRRTSILATAAGCAVATAAGCAALAAAPAAGVATASPGAPACATGGLVIWIPQSSGAAGSVFYTLEFTNQSGRACTLRGYPGVSAVDLRGHQLGSPASRDHTTRVRTITLRNNASASTTLRITEAGNFPAARCHMRDAAGLRVYPPNQRAAKIVPLPFYACSDPATVFMSVQAVRSD
jgi:hypothetical protein